MEEVLLETNRNSASLSDLMLNNGKSPTKISNFTTFLYLSKMSLGTGILAYPLVVQNVYFKIKK